MIIPDNIVEEKAVILKDQYFDLRGLRAYSALSVSTLRDHIKWNGLPAYEVRGKILVRKSEFDAWVSRHRVKKSVDIDRIVDDVIGQQGRRS
jgi:excisionase family DNA binding protein